MPFHKILCPLSVTSLPRTAATTAVRLAGTDAEVVLATSWHVPSIALAADTGGFPSSVLADMMAAEERDLAELVHECKASGTSKVSSKMLVGTPAREVLEMLDTDANIDLVVLGVDQLHRKGGMDIDANIKRILRNAPCSVFLSPPAYEGKTFRNILCPITSTDDHTSADLACELVDADGTINLLYVHELSLLEAASPRTDDDDDDDEELDKLDALAARIQVCTHAYVAPVMRKGRATVEILAALNDGRYDLVIFHDYRRALAQRIIRQARCPVLFAHGTTASAA
jgi:nucleotide-binding universal stress UspA family protein